MIRHCTKVLLICVMFTLVAPASFSQAAEKASAEAVENLFKALNIKESYEKGMQVMLDMQVKNQPQLQPLRQTMENFFLKYASWDKVKAQMAEVYAASFTDKELAEITTFLTTEAGKKWTDQQGQLNAKTAEIGQELVRSHLPELQQEIMKQMVAQQKAAQATEADDDETGNPEDDK